jgi:glycosyltransferase involved in cell wall biosynthesis
MSEPPPVLVGITTHNRADLLPRALDSLRAQSYAPRQVVVLDDGSTDATSRLRDRYPEVHWQRHEQARGIIESRNELMRAVGAEYYVSLDDDAWFLRGDEIAVAVARMQERPNLGAIAFDILSPDRPTPRERTQPQPASMFIGCGHLLRLAAVRAAGFYAPSPGTYGSEEKDLSLRLSDRDYAIELLPGVHVWHEKAWAGRDFFPVHRSGVCNELVMALRRCPAPDVFLVVPLKVLSFFWFWIRRPTFLRAGLMALVDVAGHFKLAMRTRQPVRRTTFWHSLRGRH